LRQILWNLLKNAVKFTPEEGKIDVRTYNLEMDDHGRGGIGIQVRDTGIGIEPHLIPRMFDAFEQGEQKIVRQFGGLGLGLAISKMLVELHGGRMSAYSEGRNTGASFNVELPGAHSAQNPPAASPQRDASRPGNPPAGTRKLRILLVEDHEDTSRIMCRLLRGFNHEVQAADSISSALEVASNNQFDLVISDLGLPDGTGTDLMRELRAKYGLTGIALSGYGMESDIDSSRAAGFAEHLVKPVDLQKLRTVIQKIAQ
jgi:CheY-like chemotaxis protein